MRKISIIGVAVSMALAFSATTAAALDIDVNIQAINNAAMDAVIDASGDEATATLASGDTIVLNVTVSNASADAIQAIFATLTYNNVQVGNPLGGYAPILAEGDCGFICTPPSLGTSTNPDIKGNTPAGDTTWYQALAHSNVNGTTGTGPSVGIQIQLTVNGEVGNGRVDFGIGLTAGDAISIPDPSGAPFEGELNFSGATINVPEPGTALLVSIGLLMFGARRPRATARA